MMTSKTTQAIVTPTMTPVDKPEEEDVSSLPKDWSHALEETSNTLISLYCTFRAEPVLEEDRG
jgi:hypothetical protein